MECRDFWEENMIIGTDVKALFPSLSARETGIAVRTSSKNPLSNGIILTGGYCHYILK